MDKFFIFAKKVAAFATRMNPESPDDPMRVLRKLSLIKDDRPTNACCLAFSAEDSSRTLFQVGRFKGSSLIIDSRSFSCDLFGELDGVMEFVMKHLMIGFVITGKAEHDIRHDYPVEAIREIVLNMLVHRDYRNVGGVSLIKIFDDRIEFSNPGGLPEGLTVEDLLSDGYTTQARNPDIAELFRSARLIERYGSGIRRIIDACRIHGEVEPEFKDMGAWFCVVLRKKHKNSLESGGINGGINGGIKKVVADNPGIGVGKLSKMVGVSVRTVQRAVAELKAQGVIEYCGSKKTGGYYIKM